MQQPMRPIPKHKHPVGDICAGCRQQATAFYSTPFGDDVCLRCYEADATANPDIYGDPFAKRDVWKLVRESFKRTILEQVTESQAVELGATRCAICLRVASDRSSRLAWVRLRNVWVDRSCYDRSQTVIPNSYYLDKYGRCFYLNETLRARYPFGERKLPKLHISEGASVALWEIQRDHIHSISNEYYLLAQGVCRQHYQRNKNRITLDECEDIAVRVTLAAASLFRDKPRAPVTVTHGQNDRVEPTFGNYLARALKVELTKRSVRNSKRKIKEIPNSELVYADTDILFKYGLVELQSDIEIEESYYAKRAVYLDYQTECQRILGEENWNLFTSWLLANRTQVELGRMFGITGQAVSMRLQRIRDICFKIALANEQWKQFVNLTELA